MKDKFVLPCLTCITLAICKGIASSIEDGSHGYNYQYNLPKETKAYNILARKCSILHDYINPKLRQFHDLHIIHIVVQDQINDDRIKILLRGLFTHEND